MGRPMTVAEYISRFDEAIAKNHIYVKYQAQINHTTGRMLGAEALMRWDDPEFGPQSPAEFIPVLEKNGLIYKADLHVFEEVCRFQKRCLDEGIKLMPISVNMSRYDIYNTNYIDSIEELRLKYGIPVKFLRIEVTESSAIGGMELVSSVLSRLHSLGYLVEMDDFGSGYSSLNILKDLMVDIIKLDMLFMSGDIGGRGGTILSSIIQMAKWLDTPVIAEGVETVELADHLKSLGCYYIQGYLYSKPSGEDEFIEYIKEVKHEPIISSPAMINALDSGKFWNPESMETLIFSNFVGPAALFVYDRIDQSTEILRVNKKYIKEVGVGRTEKEIFENDPWEHCDEDNKNIYKETILRAIDSGEEETCETWRRICTSMCGEEKICVRSDIRLIATGGEKCLIYAMVRNVTLEKKHELEEAEKVKIFKTAFEHANVYAWEVDVLTKDMHPCFRCMRDLNLPPVVHNYPESAIEVGIFPPEHADMYREFMKQLEDGAGTLEAIIPLTVGRIPFHVRYTTEFDETGKPLKLYGSATLVVDEDNKEEEDK